MIKMNTKYDRKSPFRWKTTSCNQHWKEANWWILKSGGLTKSGCPIIAKSVPHENPPVMTSEQSKICVWCLAPSYIIHDLSTFSSLQLVVVLHLNEISSVLVLPDMKKGLNVWRHDTVLPLSPLRLEGYCHWLGGQADRCWAASRTLWMR